MWKRPACGPLLTCSFHKCLLFFNSGNKQSILGVCVCACTQPENLLCTHKQTRKYSMGVGWVRFQSMRVHLSPWNLPQHPHYSSPGWGGQVTNIHWFGSFHLFVLFIDFHYSSSCRSLPCFRRHFHCVSSHFASRRTQAQLHAYLLASANQSTSSTFLFSPLLILCFFFFMVDLFVVNQFVQ